MTTNKMLRIKNLIEKLGFNYTQIKSTYVYCYGESIRFVDFANVVTLIAWDMAFIKNGGIK